MTLAFLLLTFLLSGEMLLLLLPFIILGLMTPPELLRILLSMARLNHSQSEDGMGAGVVVVVVEREKEVEIRCVGGLCVVLSVLTELHL